MAVEVCGLMCALCVPLVWQRVGCTRAAVAAPLATCCCMRTAGTRMRRKTRRTRRRRRARAASRAARRAAACVRRSAWPGEAQPRGEAARGAPRGPCCMAVAVAATRPARRSWWRSCGGASPRGSRRWAGWRRSRPSCTAPVSTRRCPWSGGRAAAQARSGSVTRRRRGPSCRRGRGRSTATSRGATESSSQDGQSHHHPCSPFISLRDGPAFNNSPTMCQGLW